MGLHAAGGGRAGGGRIQRVHMGVVWGGASCVLRVLRVKGAVVQYGSKGQAQRLVVGPARGACAEGSMCWLPLGAAGCGALVKRGSCQEGLLPRRPLVMEGP